MPGMLTSQGIGRPRSAAGEIDTVIACFPDMQGRLIGKRFQAEYFLDSAHVETHGCDYLLANDIDMEPVPGYAAANWEKGYGDFVMKPDLGTLRRLPWLPGTALVLCDILDHHHHEDVPHAPRAILKKQMARLAAMKMSAFFASELEFYLFDESYDAAPGDKGYRDLKTAGRYIEDYHIFQTTKEEGVMRAIRTGLQGRRHPGREFQGRMGAGPGRDQRPLRRCAHHGRPPRHPEERRARRSRSSRARRSPSWRSGASTLPAVSSHIHSSLWDAAGKKPLFQDQKGEHGMSKLMRHYIAGQLAHAREITWFLAPYINSYKRFQVGTFAPTKAIWSMDNRTAGFRLCGADTKAIRIECRIGGADLNPYLAFAALLAAGLAGIEQKLELEAPYVGDAYLGKRLREVPKTLREATETMAKSKMLRAAFGDEVIDHYVHTAEWEQFEYDRRITDWELKRGFERY